MGVDNPDAGELLPESAEELRSERQKLSVRMMWMQKRIDAIDRRLVKSQVTGCPYCCGRDARCRYCDKRT